MGTWSVCGIWLWSGGGGSSDRNVTSFIEEPPYATTLSFERVLTQHGRWKWCNVIGHRVWSLCLVR